MKGDLVDRAFKSPLLLLFRRCVSPAILCIATHYSDEQGQGLSTPERGDGREERQGTLIIAGLINYILNW